MRRRQRSIMGARRLDRQRVGRLEPRLHRALCAGHRRLGRPLSSSPIRSAPGIRPTRANKVLWVMRLPRRGNAADDLGSPGRGRAPTVRDQPAGGLLAG